MGPDENWMRRRTVSANLSKPSPYLSGPDLWTPVPTIGSGSDLFLPARLSSVVGALVVGAFDLDRALARGGWAGSNVCSCLGGSCVCSDIVAMCNYCDVQRTLVAPGRTHATACRCCVQLQAIAWPELALQALCASSRGLSGLGGLTGVRLAV